MDIYDYNNSANNNNKMQTVKWVRKADEKTSVGENIHGMAWHGMKLDSQQLQPVYFIVLLICFDLSLFRILNGSAI